MGGTWCAGMRQSDAEPGALAEVQLVSSELEDFLKLHTSSSRLYPIPLQHFFKTSANQHGCRLNACGRRKNL